MLNVNTGSILSGQDKPALAEKLSAAHASLRARTCAGAEFTDWLYWPRDYDKSEYARIKQAAARIQRDSAALVVIGIGGSYLGARAVIEALLSPNYNQLRKTTPDVYFAGCNLSGAHLKEVIDLVGDRDFSVCVISKSGTTTEPAVAFRLFKRLLEEKYGKDGACARIYAVTDQERGALRTLAGREGYETFIIPDGIGGRYSWLTPVGLLPIAVAGIDTDALLAGAFDAMTNLDAPGWDNVAWQYAASRHVLYKQGKCTEILAFYEPRLRFVGEWWKQLFGESEGKDNQGVFPASVELTADLHSMGQYIQQGLRNLMETAMVIDAPDTDLTVPDDPDDADGLNFLSGLPLHEINRRAFEGTFLAHTDGGVPNIVLRLPRLDAYELGGALYFFMLSCALSVLLLSVNPFDQPGVEAYKVNMFALLNKPGYEDQGEKLRARLSD